MKYECACTSAWADAQVDEWTTDKVETCGGG
jgi:hypothetical protein